MHKLLKKTTIKLRAELMNKHSHKSSSRHHSRKCSNFYPVISLFLRCGVAGWCLEIMFTALKSLKRRDFHLMGMTSLWMFPIYGCAAFLKPLSKRLQSFPVLLRGSLYAFMIFAAEYFAGNILDKADCCPWDYSRNHHRVGPHIRLDFFPLWFLTGLFYERFTNQETQLPAKSPFHTKSGMK